MSCIEDWKTDYRRSVATGLPMIDISCLPGPPEVRVMRLSLSTRPQECRGPATDQPRAPRPPRQGPSLSPLRVRNRKTKKKKPQKTQTSVEIDSNKLPMSITLGRALGAQVQPLMAILMSPRVRTCSLDSDCSEDESQSDCEQTTARGRQGKAPLLSITSLELPDLAQARGPAHQLVRRVRTSVRRSRPTPPNNTTAQAQSTQTLACAGLALARH